MNQLNNNLYRKLTLPPLWALLLLYVLVWIVSQLVSHTNFDPTGDMLENFIWGQHFAWGNLKHPPLVGWVTGAWFEVFPRTAAAYHGLAYGNAALGLLGVYALARQLNLGQHARAACLLLALALPYSTLAGKFNANTVLLSIWPWLVVTWLGAMQSPGLRSVAYAVPLGLLSAAAMLGKYYSGVLLLSLFALTIGLAQGRAWLKRPGPWIAVLVALGLLAPHLQWLQQNDFAPFRYVQDQGSGEFDAEQFIKFLVAPLLYSLPAFVVCLLIVPRTKLPMLIKAWLPLPHKERREDILFYLTCLPFLFTIAFAVTGFVSLSSPWAIPLVFTLPLLWLRNLVVHLPDHRPNWLDTRVQNVFFGFLCLVLLLSPVYAWHQGKSGEENYYLPAEEAVFQTELLWFERMKAPYEWVAGDYGDAGAVSFYGSVGADYTEQLPRLPAASGLIFCHLGEAEKAVKTSFCTQRAERWSRPRDERITKIEFTVMKEGFRFSHQVPHVYRVYFYEHP